ncbi:MAG: hypothetical protein D6765_08445 [Bacteroidetes bacterium]|nr:MAG: hypothetical protein D6765_08445 [Bacteroidota bacterium]
MKTQFLAVMLCCPFFQACMGCSPNEATREATGEIIRTTEAECLDVPPVTYVTYTDPAEGAFSLEVPKGWKTEGSLNRKTALAYSPWVRITSPDGGTVLFFGDANLPTFLVPGGMGWMGGREGQWVPGYEGVMAYRSYRNGEQFAQEYAQTFGDQWGSCRLLETRPEHRLSARVMQEVRQYFGPWGLNPVVSGGEVRFTCGRNQEYTGRVLAVTVYLEGYGMRMWSVDRLGGFVAPGNRSEEVEAIFHHVLYSFRLNPQWKARQDQLAAQISTAQWQAHAQWQSQAYNNISKTLSETSDIVINGWNQNQATLDNAMRKYSNAFRGTEDVYNPQTQQQYNIWDQYNYYWQAPDGTIIGTYLNQNPQPGTYTPLRRRQ